MALNEGVIDYDQMSAEQLDLAEKKLAGPYLRMFPIGIIIWGFTNTLVWLSLWPLVFSGVLSLWIAFPIAVLSIALTYLPSHDAQHSIIARRGKPLRWLNELLGHVSLIPLAASFRVLRHTHMEHHRNTNNPELDPDFDVHAESAWDFFRQQIGNPFGNNYSATLVRIKRPELVLEAALFNGTFLLILFSLAWLGFAIEAALLWWLPRHIALLWLKFYLSWMPHHPGEEQGRYRDTRAFRSFMGNIWSGGMQFHIIHHLYPTIPLMQTPAAYRDLRPILERRGCDLGGL